MFYDILYNVLGHTGPSVYEWWSSENTAILQKCLEIYGHYIPRDYLLIKDLEIANLKELINKYELVIVDCDTKLKLRDLKIDELTTLLDKYETALVKRDQDNTKIVQILDSYRNKINTLMYENDNLQKVLVQKNDLISILKKKNLNLMTEINQLKSAKVD